jgi:hypothetical protein
MSISIRVRAIPPAAEDVGARSLIPEDVDLEAIVHRGEDDCVVDAEGKPAGELARFLDEVDALGPPLELHLDDSSPMYNHTFTGGPLFFSLLANQVLLQVGRHGRTATAMRY